MNFKALRQYFTRKILGLYDLEEADALFYIVAEKVSGWGRAKVIFNQDKPVNVKELQTYEDIINQLRSGKPLQYILNEAHFYGLTFMVNPSVLIPRAETEELVNWIVAIAGQGDSNGDLLDIGTGSGCIGITLKKHLTDWNVFAMDISPTALAVAALNAKANNVQVQFIEADALVYHSQQQFDIIVSNPPYIKEDEKAAMQANVLDFEPHSALFVSNQNPLVFYKAIADLALKNLRKKGYLFFEINEYLAEQTVAMLAAKGFKNIELKKDMQGKDRMICCRIMD